MTSAPIVASDAERLAQYCPDLANWARSWRGEDRDIAPGQQLVECFKPFLLHLLDAELSRTTLRNHRDHLWMLGGEIVRALYDDPRLRKRPIGAVLAGLLEDDGGPLIYPRITEAEQRSFDSTCRKLHRFLQGQTKPI